MAARDNDNGALDSDNGALDSGIAHLQENDPAKTELEFVMFCLIFGEKLTGGV